MRTRLLEISTACVAAKGKRRAAAIKRIRDIAFDCSKRSLPRNELSVTFSRGTGDSMPKGLQLLHLPFQSGDCIEGEVQLGLLL